METYKIAVRFRERHIQGYVQKFPDHFDVFLQDEEVLQSFGGMISFDVTGKFKTPKRLKPMMRINYTRRLVNS
jgi:hypothetical protein